MSVQINHYVIDTTKCIGRGSSGVVYLGYDTITKQQVAIKKIYIDKDNITTENRLSKLWNEIQIMKQLKHKNIVELLNVHLDIEKNVLYLIMEYCDGSDLSNYTRCEKLSMSEVQDYMRQMRDGLEYLHTQKVVHRDLKPHNILLSKGCIKLSDFGLSTMNNEEFNLMKTICGSPLYMSPELIQHKKYTAKSDLWSVGVIMYQLIFLMHPFPGCQNFKELSKNVKNCDIVYPTDETIDPMALELLKGLLNKNCHERINWLDFFNHKWFHPSNNLSTTQSNNQLQPLCTNSINESSNHSLYGSLDEESQFNLSIGNSINKDMNKHDMNKDMMNKHDMNKNMNKDYSNKDYSNKNQEVKLNNKRLSIGYSSSQPINERLSSGYPSSKPVKIIQHNDKCYSTSPSINIHQFIIDDYIGQQRPIVQKSENSATLTKTHNFGTSAPSPSINTQTPPQYSPHQLSFHSLGSNLLKYVNKSLNIVKSSLDT